MSEQASSQAAKPKKAPGGGILVALVILLGLFIIGALVISNMESETQTFAYKPVTYPITNPLIGLAPWATVETTQQPHTLVYADLSWRDFEPQQGEFDFAAFEKRNQFARWRAEGQHVIFRFICDYPENTAHRDIPDWLFAAIKGDGDTYAGKYGKGFSPNYSNPIFISFHQKAIKALGDRYGQDGFIAFIELGSLGHWGEWHTDETAGVRNLPLAEIRDLYVHQYRQAFPNTQLLMRRPFSIAQQLNLGLYNDQAGNLTSTEEWLTWINKGGVYEETGEVNGLKAMPDGWKYAPMGGEQDPSIKVEDLYAKNLDQTTRLIKDSHFSYIGPGGPYDLKYGGPLQSGLDQVLQNIGYRLYTKEFVIPRRLILKDRLDFNITFGNDGAAPIYYNWPTDFYLYDEYGNLRGTFPSDLDIRKILPGESYKHSFSISLPHLETGIYYVGIAILDPLTGKPAVRLAMENNRSDLIQVLGSFEISRLKIGQYSLSFR